MGGRVVAWAGKRWATMDDGKGWASFPQNFFFEEIYHKTLREHSMLSALECMKLIDKIIFLICC